MGKVRTIYRGGSRFYVHPADREIIHPGVTSIIGMLPKQSFLGPWNAKMAAELAVDSIDFVKEMAARDREGAIDYLKGAARRYTGARSSLGSDAHDLFERMMRGEGGLTEREGLSGRFVHSVRSDLEPYRAHFAEFMEAVNPELVRAEDVVWSDTYGYAGSFDAWLRVWFDKNGIPTPDRSGTPYLIMDDWKTSARTYPDVALQLSAYQHADYVIDAEGVQSTLPEFDGAFVLHITDDDWQFHPVDAGPEVFEYFLALRKTFDWDREVSKRVIGKPVARKAGGKLETGTQRRGR